MSIPYTDQIWTVAKCREFEGQAIRDLQDISCDYCVCVVDAIPEDETKVITDNLVTDPNIKSVALFPEFWGGYAYNPVYVNSLPLKNFNCFINRTDPMRQSWFYQLVRRGIINEGNVSFNLAYRHSDFKALDNLSSREDRVELYDWIFSKGMDIFEQEHNAMRDKVPFKNFSIDLDQATVDSKISLVIETYFDRHHIIALSEKIFRQLQLPRPFLLWCAPNAVKLLRDNGFDVYDDYIDHSYDECTNDIERQTMILDSLEKYAKMQYNTDMLTDFESRAEHNRQLLKSFLDRWPARVEEIKKELENQ